VSNWARKAREDRLDEKLYEFYREAMEDPNVPFKDKLRIADRLLDKTVPSLKTIEHKNLSPVQIIYTSPQHAAQEVVEEIEREKNERYLNWEPLPKKFPLGLSPSEEVA